MNTGLEGARNSEQDLSPSGCTESIKKTFVKGKEHWWYSSSCHLRFSSYLWHPSYCHINVHTWPISITVEIFLVSTMMWPSGSCCEQLSSAQPSVVRGRHHQGKKHFSCPAPELCAEMLNHVIACGLESRDPGNMALGRCCQDLDYTRVYWRDTWLKNAPCRGEVNLVPWRPHKSTRRAFVCK